MVYEYLPLQICVIKCLILFILCLWLGYIGTYIYMQIENSYLCEAGWYI